MVPPSDKAAPAAAYKTTRPMSDRSGRFRPPQPMTMSAAMITTNSAIAGKTTVIRSAFIGVMREPNDEVERREVALLTIETDLSTSSTPS